jgi:hypothetical protein
MSFHYNVVCEATLSASGPCTLREVAAIAYTYGAKRDQVLAALSRLGVGLQKPDSLALLEDLGLIEKLPEKFAGAEPDWTSDGVEIWVLSKQG